MNGTAVVDRRRGDTKERLVNVALELFAEKGYEGTRVADLEGAVGLRPGGGGMYRHFASKEDLLVASMTAYRDRVRALRAELAAAPTDAEAAEDLRRIVRGFARFLRGEGKVLHVTSSGGQLPDSARRMIGEAWDEAYGTIVDLIARRGAFVDDPEVVAVEAIGSLAHYLSHVATWQRKPLRVEPDRFLSAWVERWSAAFEV